MSNKVKICGCEKTVDLKCLFNTSEGLNALGISETEEGINIFKKVNDAFADLSDKVESIISTEGLTCPTPSASTENVDTYVLTFDCNTNEIKFIPARLVKLI